MNVNVIFQDRSTNGRWGLTVVGPEGTKFPAEGSVRDLGEISGYRTFEFLPGETGQWVLPTGAVTVHAGATEVFSMGLQSSRACTLLVLGPEAVVEHHSRIGRKGHVVAYDRGVETYVPPGVLLAMGVIKPEPEDAGPINPPPPPPLQGAMAAAFAALKGGQQ
jgi:hypothetical protein